MCNCVSLTNIFQKDFAHMHTIPWWSNLSSGILFGRNGIADPGKKRKLSLTMLKSGSKSDQNLIQTQQAEQI